MNSNPAQRPRVNVGRFGILVVALLAVDIGRAQSPDTQSPNAPRDWPQFLGPHRNGISDETGLLETWPDGGPKEVWREAGGVGMSGLAIARDRLVTLVQREGQQWVISLNARTGERVWQTAIAPEFRNSMGDGPRATPAIAGDLVYVLGGDGTLAALNFADGKLAWRHRPLQELKGKPADYGMACSPLIAGDYVIVTVGAPRATVVAYHKTTGEQVWNAGSDPAGYSSPALLNVGDTAQVVVFTGSSVMGVSPGMGKLMWRFPFVTDFQCNIVTPIAFQGHVFISSGENHGSVLLRVQRKADEYEITPAWESLGPRSVLRAEWQTPVLLNGHLYGFDNVGSAGPVTHLTCVNAATGERVWQQPRFGKGNMIAADGKLFISTVEGELVIVRAATEKFDEIGRKVVAGSTRQAPAIADGRLYLRDDENIVCLDVRARPE